MKTKALLSILILIVISNSYSQAQMYSSEYGKMNMNFDQNSEQLLPKISLYTQESYRLDSLITIALTGDQGKSVFTYHDGNVVIAERSYLTNNKWKLGRRVVLTYNDHGQIIEYKGQDLLNDSIWFEDRRDLYEYNESNKLAYIIRQLYKQGSWENFHRTLYSYSDGYREEITQHYDQGDWVDRTLYHNYISDNGNIDSTFIYQRDDTTWNDYLRIYSQYNEFNKWDYVVSLQWINSSWTFGASAEANYDDNGNLLQVNYYDWSNQFEELVSRLVYSYDSNGNLTEVYFESRTGDSWSPAMDTIVIEITDNYTEGYMFAHKVKLYYSPISSVDDNELSADFTLSQNYPNPFNPSTTIKFTIPTSPFNPSPYQGEGNRERLVSLLVYDILGREIKTLLNKPMQPGSYEVEFDGSEFTSGVYFYVLETGGKRLSKKMLLIK